jgi:8-oxo-dGTP pyrophosphatase MutT (NUDIX family)
MDNSSKYSQPIETVRCIIENNAGEVLLLQKALDSKASLLYEFPGGKIENETEAEATLGIQLETVTKEVEEETGILLQKNMIHQANEFLYEFEYEGSLIKRKVYLFHTKLREEKHPITINQVKDEAGSPEDKHIKAIWIDKEKLIQLKDQGLLSGNTQNFEKILQII